MRGTIQILNSENCTGRILLDGRESGIMTFPETFESGDRAEVEFFKDDPQEKCKKLIIPGEQWYYGFIMKLQQGPREVRRILITYPQVKGLISIDHAQVSAFADSRFNLPVKFRIKKTLDGRTCAVDIIEPMASERYKCKEPLFGRLEKAVLRPDSGVVQQIVRTANSDARHGVIESIRVKNRGLPEEGDIVYFLEQDAKLVFYQDDSVEFPKLYFAPRNLPWRIPSLTVGGLINLKDWLRKRRILEKIYSMLNRGDIDTVAGRILPSG